MFDPVRPGFPVERFDGGPVGAEGNNGWVSDHFMPDFKTIFIEGISWDDNPTAPYRGKGDLATSAKIWRNKSPWGKVHKGFHEYALNMLFILEQRFGYDPSKPEWKKIVLYGHSMGAAVVPILSAYLHEMGTEVFPVLMASPPFASFKFKKKFESTFPHTENVYVGRDFLYILTSLVRWFYPDVGTRFHFKAKDKIPFWKSFNIHHQTHVIAPWTLHPEDILWK